MNTEDFVRTAFIYGYVIRSINPNASDGYKVDYYEDINVKYLQSVQWDHRRGEGYVVQTTAYGALPTADIDLVINGYHRAKRMAELLNETDLSKLDEYLHPALRAERD